MARLIGFEAIRELTAAAIGASYTIMGSVLSFNAKQFIFTNSLNGDVLVSFDNSDDHIRLPASTSLILNFVDSDMRKAGTGVYIKDGASAPSSGTLSLSVVHHM